MVDGMIWVHVAVSSSLTTSTKYCGQDKRLSHQPHKLRGLSSTLKSATIIMFIVRCATVLWLLYRSVSERFKEPVLKTGDSERNLGFESLTLRQKRSTSLYGVWIFFDGMCGFEPISMQMPGGHLHSAGSTEETS